MSTPQPGILAPPPRHARFVTYRVQPGADVRAALRRLASTAQGGALIVGLGSSLVTALGASVLGLRPFPALATPAVAIPSTPAALWCAHRGDDRGDLLHAARKLGAMLEPEFLPTAIVDAFQYRNSRDLTGYEDGTENPEGEDAIRAAIAPDGSSFVAVQRWVHDLDAFDAMPERARDNVIGRRIADNEEIDDAPRSAHVKRTAQEQFEPSAFVVRRSMPWTDGKHAGLVFIAFGCSFDAFEAQLTRMAGIDDGIVDALFSFTHPVTGSYFWCPPLAADQIDLSAVL